MTIYTTPESLGIPTTPSRAAQASSAFGSGIQQGLGSGLEILAQDKIEKMKHDRLQSLLKEISPGSQTKIDAQERSQSEQIPNEAILALAEKYPNAAKILQGQKESQIKQKEARAKREFERVKPVLARADERAEGITQKENSLSLMEDAIKSGDIGYFSKDNLANITGIEGLRSAKGAQFISSGKEYFLGSIKRAGSRPNQWIEQQIQKMLPQIGRSVEANQTVVEALKSELTIEKENLDIIDRLSQEDEEKFGYIKGNIGQRARKELKTFADQEQKDLESRLRIIQSSSLKTEVSDSEVMMIDPIGNIRKVKKSQASEAKKEGYKLYK